MRAIMITMALCAACATPYADTDPMLVARWDEARKACAVAVTRICGNNNPCAFDVRQRCLAEQGYERRGSVWHITREGRRMLDLGRSGRYGRTASSGRAER